MALEPALKHPQDSSVNQAGVIRRSRRANPLKVDNIDLLNTRWYLSRLASMQPAEIVWRARSAATLPLDWALSKRQSAVPAPRWTSLCPASYPVQLHNSGVPMESVRVFDLEFPLGF